MSAVNTDWYTQSPTAAQAARVNSANDYVSTDQFLTLLITQMTNQDPMNPMEDIDFTGQMASLQALDEQIKTNKVMQAMRVDTQVANVTGMIGKFVSGVDITGATVNGVVKQAVVESDVVYVETTGGARIPLDNVGKVWNPDVAKVEDIKNASALIGWLVQGMTENNNQYWGVVDAVTTDADGNIMLALKDGTLVYYNSVTDISDWYYGTVDDGETDGEGETDGTGETDETDETDNEG